jgi:hypothetical protein
LRGVERTCMLTTPSPFLSKASISRRNCHTHGDKTPHESPQWTCHRRTSANGFMALEACIV